MKKISWAKGVLFSKKHGTSTVSIGFTYIYIYYNISCGSSILNQIIELCFLSARFRYIYEIYVYLCKIIEVSN